MGLAALAANQILTFSLSLSDIITLLVVKDQVDFLQCKGTQVPLTSIALYINMVGGSEIFTLQSLTNCML